MKKDELGEAISYAVRPRIELIGNTGCVVEGIREIAACSGESIKISLGRLLVTFSGSGLVIRSFSPEGAVIEGIIVSVEFEGNG